MPWRLQPGGYTQLSVQGIVAGSVVSAGTKYLSESVIGGNAVGVSVAAKW